MRFLKPKKKRVYLDYAAATPLRARVFDAMRPYLSRQFANPSAVHTEGVKMRVAIEGARSAIAKLLKARSEHVFFTGSGTESNNLAIIGTVEARRDAGVSYTDMEIISTRVEHPSVSETLAYLEKRGVTVQYVSVDEDGLIDTAELKSLLSEKTVLVTLAYINSEVGVIQDMAKVARTVREYERGSGARIYVHADGAQAPLWCTCEMDRLMVDILTLDAGKCYGPKGVGLLVHRHGVELTSVLYGGPQESGLRPATENTAGIIGAATALEIALSHQAGRVQKITALRNYLIAELQKLEGVVLNGSAQKRVANNVNISIPGIDSEFAVIVLDEAGIAASTKSACSGAQGGGSQVVREMTGDTARAESTIRFSLGEDTTRSELAFVVRTLAAHIEKTTAAQATLTRS